MKKQSFLFCLLVLVLFPLSMNPANQKENEISSALTEKILRFHILANSDSSEDQALKLEVRDFLLTKIQDEMQAEASSKQMLQSCIAIHKKELETAAEDFMKKRGFSYPAQIELSSSYFPAREYAGFLFPAGTYDAVRVLLGNAEGHNWWCVLYPSLAFSAEGIKAADTESASETKEKTSLEKSQKNKAETALKTAPEIRFKSLEWLRGQKHLESKKK